MILTNVYQSIKTYEMYPFGVEMEQIEDQTVTLTENPSYGIGIRAPENFAKSMLILAYHHLERNFFNILRLVQHKNEIYIKKPPYSLPSALVAVVKVDTNEYAFFDVSHGEWHGTFGCRVSFSRSELMRHGILRDVENNMDAISKLDIAIVKTNRRFYSIKL